MPDKSDDPEDAMLRAPLIVAQPVENVTIVIPIAVTYPDFAKLEAPVPENFNSAISPELWGVIHSSNNFTIRQHVKLAPKNCCKCPPCVSQENSYSIYAGLSQNAEHELLRVDEISSDWNRCCCKPYHPLRLEVRQYLPVPGDRTASDYGHIRRYFELKH